jgi:hypothetical protein
MRTRSERLWNAGSRGIVLISLCTQSQAIGEWEFRLLLGWLLGSGGSSL